MLCGFKMGKGNVYEIDLCDKWYGCIYCIVYCGEMVGDVVNDLLLIDLYCYLDCDFVGVLSYFNLLW